MFFTGDINKAVNYSERPPSVKTVGSLSRDSNHTIAGHVTDFDAELEALPNKAEALRVGLAMLAGWEKGDAENERFVPKQGRPAGIPRSKTPRAPAET
jgi:hypothetical protein